MGVRFPLRAPSNTAKNYSSPSCAKIIPRNISDTSPTLTQNFERTKMASFYKRKLADSTVWEVKIRRKGYPIQMHSFDKRGDAEKWAREIEAEIDRGIFVSRKEAENTTLAEALSRYEEEVSKYKKGYPQEKKRIRSWCVFRSKVATCSGQNCHPQGEFFHT